MAAKKEEIDLKEIFNVFLKKIWIIALVAVVFGLFMGIYSSAIKADTYSSKSTLMVSKENNTTVESSDITLASKMVETYKIVICSDSFLNAIIEDINSNPLNEGWKLNTTQLKNMFEVKQRGETEVFDILVTTKNSTLSYIIADTIATHVKNNLPKVLPYPDGVIYTSIIDPAVMPMKANSNHVLRNVVLGGLIGAIIAMAVIFFIWYNDVTIRSRKSIEENLDIPVLGIIPKWEVSEE